MCQRFLFHLLTKYDVCVCVWTGVMLLWVRPSSWLLRRAEWILTFHMPLGYFSDDWLSAPQLGLFSMQLCEKKIIINMYSFKKMSDQSAYWKCNDCEHGPRTHNVVQYDLWCQIRGETFFFFDRTSPAVFHGPDPSLLIRNWIASGVTAHWPMCSIFFSSFHTVVLMITVS